MPLSTRPGPNVSATDTTSRLDALRITELRCLPHQQIQQWLEQLVNG